MTERRIIIHDVFYSHEEVITALRAMLKDAEDGLTGNTLPHWEIQEGQKPYTDETPCPFGKHSGKKLKDVPDDWLLWFYNQNKDATITRPQAKLLFDYCVANIDAIKNNVDKRYS